MDTQLEQARHHFLDGVAAFEAGQLETARTQFEISLTLAPGRISVLGNLGITLFHLQRWQEAIDTLQQATAGDPEYAEAWICLGLAHEARGNWAQAAGALEHGLQRHQGAAMPWLALGRSFARLGHCTEAMRALDKALEFDASLAETWSVRGNVLRDLDRLDDAARCFEKAIALGADPELHAYYLAAARGNDHPNAPPRHYVEALFDEYSADFDTHLVEQLGYRGHERLLRPLIASGQHYREVLDLGCGTGLCGALVAPHADAVDGVDVSAAMLEQANRLGVYRELAHDDITSFLADAERHADLVVAADVFIYVGALEPVFAAVRRLLKPGGCFAFTVELTGDEHDYRLQTSLRYAHSQAYIRRLAEEHGFGLRALRTEPLREDQREAIDALYVYLE